MERKRDWGEGGRGREGEGGGGRGRGREGEEGSVGITNEPRGGGGGAMGGIPDQKAQSALN